MRWQLRNSATAYGQAGRILHWTSVALLAVIVVISAQFEGLTGGPEKSALIGRHASYGLLLLLLMLLRAAWRFTNINPVASFTIRAWQKRLAVSIHLFVYTIVISQCVIGIAQLVTHDPAITIFGTVDVGTASAGNAGIRELLRDWHAGIARLIYITISIHVCAAIYHHIFGVVERDTS